MRKFKFLFSLIIIVMGGYMVYQFVQNNTSEQKIDYQVQGAQTEVTDKNNLNTVANSNKKINSDGDSAIGKTTSEDDFSVLVQSSLYNAVVSLDETSKEVNIKLLDDVSDYTQDSVSHYINISDSNLEYLLQNSDSLLDEFKNGNLVDKYNLVTTMLQSYDTNINQGDLIGIALNFLK